MTRPAPMHWHDQIADRTREVYASETSRERIEEIEDAAYARADALLAVSGDYDADRERRAWNELARVCARQKARVAQRAGE